VDRIVPVVGNLSHVAFPAPLLQLSANVHDFLRTAVATIVRLTCHGIHLQLVPIPLNANRWSAARTIEQSSLQKFGGQREQIRTVGVWTEPRQIPRQALRAFHAMANTRRHGMRQLPQTRIRARAGNVPALVERNAQGQAARLRQMMVPLFPMVILQSHPRMRGDCSP
jgi:hypothetical protein